MSDTPRERFRRGVAEQAKHQSRLQRNAVAEIQRILREALARVTLEIARAGNIDRRTRLVALQAEIRRTLATFGDEAGASASSSAERAWDAGVDLVEKPLASAGVQLASAPRINRRALLAMQSFLTDRISDVTRAAIDRINRALGLVLTGTLSQSDAITQVQRILGGATRTRASTIVFTEIGRAYATASQAAMLEAHRRGIGIAKRWVRSGKEHPRPEHYKAHNQMVRVDQPFVIAGEKLDYPRDPKASAENTINCGCMAVPVLSGSRFGASVVEVPVSPHERVRLVTPAQRAASTQSVLEEANRRLRALGLPELPATFTLTTSSNERGVMPTPNP